MYMYVCTPVAHVATHVLQFIEKNLYNKNFFPQKDFTQPVVRVGVLSLLEEHFYNSC